LIHLRDGKTVIFFSGEINKKNKSGVKII